MPALMFSLPSNVCLGAIESAIQKLSLEEYLRLEGFEEELSSASLPPSSIAGCNSKPNQTSTSLEAMRDVLYVAVEKIAELEGRLTRLEQTLQNDSFDRDKCLAILQGKV